MHRAMLVLTLAACGSTTPATPAPGRTRPPADRPESIDPFLAELTETLGYQLGHPFAISATPTGDEILFLRSGPRERDAALYGFDPATGRERRIAGAEDLGQQRISVAEQARRERTRQVMTGIYVYQLSEDGDHILIPYSGRLFLVDRAATTVRELGPLGGPALDPQLAPDAGQVSFARDGDLWVLDVKTGIERQLTHRPSPEVSFGTSEFVAQEEMGRMHGAWWSPDGTRLIVQKTDAGPVDTVYLADPQHPEGRPRALPYPLAGTANAIVELAIIDAGGGEPTWIRWDRQRYPYVVRVRWSPNAPPTLLVADRLQREAAVLAVDPDSGATEVLQRERDEAWLNVALHEEYPRWLPDGSGYVWLIERSGHRRLELRDRAGEPLRWLSPEDLVIKKLAGIDEDAGAAYVTATTDAVESHVYRIDLTGDRVTRLTEARGVHEAAAPGRGAALVIHSALADGKRTHEVYRDGARAGRLDTRAVEPPWVANVEVTTATAGDLTFNAALVRPRNFDPSRRYPVIVEVYGGPGSVEVSADPRQYLTDQWMADHGFVVIRIDGRGTPYRTRDWERATHLDFVQVALRDQVAALRALGATHPELDLDRVGIAGWSFGGTMAAAAVLLHPEVFRAAVSGAPVTDWRYYDTLYTERYLGLPEDQPDAYRRSSPLSYADRLRRPLLLVHGTVDDNVLPLHTLRLSDELFRAGRDHDLLLLSGLTHMVPDPVVKSRLHRRIVDFFRDHLVDPPADAP